MRKVVIYMSFFEKFQRTVFVKDDSELEEKLNSLKAIRDKVVEKDEIEKEIKISELGLIGEKRIEYELKCANIGMYVLHDVNVVVDELTAQVDWVVITPAYCYLIECKNLIGNVTVNSQGEFRRYYQYKGKKIAEAIKPTIMVIAKESVKLALSIIKQRNEDIEPAIGIIINTYGNTVSIIAIKGVSTIFKVGIMCFFINFSMFERI